MVQKGIVFEIKRFPYTTPPDLTLRFLFNFQRLKLNFESLLHTEFASNQHKTATQDAHMSLLSDKHNK